jgi:hypothetical protein
VDRAVANLNGSRRRPDGATLSTLGTKLVITEALELESENFLNGTLDDSLTHIDSQRFDRIEIEVKPWAFLSVSASANDFSPSVRHVSEFGQFVRLTFGERHDVFVLELAKSGKWEIQLDMIPTPSSSAKCDLHPPFGLD